MIGWGWPVELNFGFYVKTLLIWAWSSLLRFILTCSIIDPKKISNFARVFTLHAKLSNFIKWTSGVHLESEIKRKKSQTRDGEICEWLHACNSSLFGTCGQSDLHIIHNSTAKMYQFQSIFSLKIFYFCAILSGLQFHFVGF